MSTKGNKGSYVVMLEQAKQPPKLIASVKPLGGNKYLLCLIHPNTRKVILEREEECESLNDAMNKANKLKDLPEAKEVQTWYEETLFIPQPKRGKMKLKTKESVEEEMNLEAEEMDDSDDFGGDDEDEKPKASKNIKKAPKGKKTAPKKVKKEKIKPVKKNQKN